MMRSRDLYRQRQRISTLIEEASKFKEDQGELQAHWAKYICVLVAGFMENAIADVYSRYAAASSNEKVSNHVAYSMKKINNPKHTKFVDVAKSFDGAWGHQVEEFFEEDGMRDALNSIMSQRHLIAHGQDSDISLVRVKDYFRKCTQIITFIENQCGVQAT